MARVLVDPLGDGDVLDREAERVEEDDFVCAEAALARADHELTEFAVEHPRVVGWVVFIGAVWAADVAVAYQAPEQAVLVGGDERPVVDEYLVGVQDHLG